MASPVPFCRLLSPILIATVLSRALDTLFSSSPPIEFIERSAHLEEFCRALEQAPWIGLDTEFMRECTYYPEFCLLQVSMDDRIACIDPLALPTLDPLKSVLNDHRVLKILHSGRQDLELFHLLWGLLPVNVFDTQIAAALAGGPEQIGYGRLVECLFEVKLAKEQTRTDWSHRPLSPAQLRYAADDVAFLGAAHQHLRQSLTEMGRIEWLIEDSSALLEPSLYHNKPELAWRKIAGIQHLPPQPFHLVQKLAAWREAKSQQLNLPRGWIFKDDVLFHLATQNHGEAVLPRIRGIDQLSHQHCVDEVRELLKDLPTSSQRSVKVLTRPKQLESESKTLLKKLAGIVQAKASELDITPSALASRRDLEMVLENPAESRVLNGWRSIVIGEEILELLPTASIPRDNAL